ILLGFACGVVSWLFIISLTGIENFYRKNKFTSSIFGTIISGLTLGGIGLLLPYTMGTGYDTIDLAITNQLVWNIALLLVFIKIASTGITLASGGTGGIFAPAILVGATLGVTTATFFNWLLPGYSPPSSAMSIIGIAGLLAGTMHAPFTAIIVVFELTKNQDFILPAMITTIISVAISKTLVKESIYTIPIEFKNSLIKYRNELNLMDNILVCDYYKTDFTVIYENQNLSNVIETIIKDKNKFIIVNDLNDSFYGIITIEVVKELILDKEIMNKVIIAGDIAYQNIPAIKVNQSIKKALEVLNKYSLDVLPVFSDENFFLGIIDRKAIDEVYADELSKLNMSISLASNVSQSISENYVYLSNDLILSEVQVPEKFVGKSIKELDIRLSLIHI
ncbi:MAG: chloride channel protein, partial [candidate division WOR-3 bacterium]|nr:chloride channel protein [candidate division WOR-3 bacterium]